MTGQAEVLAFLSDPALHGGQRPERIDTHISAVFLGPERVFKLKKAVHLPFLDFSALDQRKAACEAEVAVNRDAAPGLYLGVDAITRGDDGALALNGAGRVCDYVVTMRRFTALLDPAQLDRTLLADLTDRIAACHANAPVRGDHHGGQAGLAWTIKTNAASFAAHCPAVFAPQAVADLTQRSSAWLDRLAPLLEARRAGGFVRRCHGDLHLGNLCLFEGRPTPFDAIEFSEDIACVDVAYDLAFLLMDLDVQGYQDAASQIMNRMLDRTGDFAGLAAMPLFLSLRAAVRAHVSASMGRVETAQRYFGAALGYLSPPPARLVAIGGLSGSGKSHMGRNLAPLLGVPGAAMVRSDAVRKRLLGVAPTDRLGEDGYCPEMTERTYQTLFDLCAGLLRAGVPVIADAVFARPDQRAALERVAAKAGVPFTGLWLFAAPEIARARVAQRSGDASDATPEVVDRQQDYDLGVVSWTKIDTGGGKDETVTAARTALGLEAP